MILKPVTQLPSMDRIKGLYVGLAPPGNAARYLPNGVSHGLEKLVPFGGITEEFYIPMKQYRQMERDPKKVFSQLFTGEDFYAKGVQALTSKVPPKSLEDLAHYIALLTGVGEVLRQVHRAVPEASIVYLNCDSSPRPLNPKMQNDVRGKTIRTTGPGYLIIGNIFTDVNPLEKKRGEEEVAVNSRYL